MVINYDKQLNLLISAFYYLLRLIGVAIAIVTAAVLAVGLASLMYSELLTEWLGDDHKAHTIIGHLRQYGPTAAGGAIFVATLRELFKSLPSAVKCVRAWNSIALFGSSLTIFVAIFSFTLIVLSIEDPLVEVKDETPIIIGLSPGVALGDDRSSANFFITFSEDATVESIEGRGGVGLDVSGAYEEMLSIVGESLTECASENNDPPEVIITGIASSSPFAGKTEVESRPLNRKLANLRATVVTNILKKYVDNSIIIKTIQWDSYEDMIQARRFRDRTSSGEYSKKMALFTRRAEVRVISAGYCQVATPLGL